VWELKNTNFPSFTDFTNQHKLSSLNQTPHMLYEPLLPAGFLIFQYLSCLQLFT